jgi:hypothetical protein
VEENPAVDMKEGQPAVVARRHKRLAQRALESQGPLKPQKTS